MHSGLHGNHAVRSLILATVEITDTIKQLPEPGRPKLRMGMHKGNLILFQTIHKICICIPGPLVGGMLSTDAPHYTVLGSTLEIGCQLMKTSAGKRPVDVCVCMCGWVCWGVW